MLSPLRRKPSIDLGVKLHVDIWFNTVYNSEDKKEQSQRNLLIFLHALVSLLQLCLKALGSRVLYNIVVVQRMCFFTRGKAAALPLLRVFH